MALHTVCGERPPLMPRIDCIRVTRPVAINTIRGCTRVLVVHVTQIACGGDMRSCERKACRAMIKRCRTKRYLRMATLAFGREPPYYMIGVCCAVVIRLVARNALLRSGFEHLILMTRKARRRCVCAQQWKFRPCMIESRPPPERVHLMTLNAIRGEPSRRMVRSFRSRKVISMATETICWRPRVLSLRRVDMTCLAGERRMLS